MKKIMVNKLRELGVDKRMTFKARRVLSPAVMGCVLLMAACGSDECYDNKNSLPLAGFYSSSEEPVSISLDSVSVFGIGAPGDSVLHDSVSGLSQSYLPFRIDQGSTTFVIRYLQGMLGRYRVADTVSFNYEIEPWFVSSACGVVYDYKISSIETTHNIIDSVVCPSGVIDNVDSENIRIYFRVAIEEEEE
ncbi:MAG: hypothetical protein K2F94_06020 [Muribaculaceae bacterium]|nr:hypothetical protein [Muribaculaceae bacterium]MDE6772109.1 hypothetical protein [Muribaculaceae bacterium]